MSVTPPWLIPYLAGPVTSSLGVLARFGVRRADPAEKGGARCPSLTVPITPYCEGS